MPFDWLKAVEKNRDDLLMIVTRLFIMAGIRSFTRVTVLPYGVRLRILAILRPAEFAARRLIAMAACGLVTVTMPPARKREGPPPSSVILGLDPKTTEAPSSLARTHSGESATQTKMKTEDPSSNAGWDLRLRGVDPRVEPEDDARRGTPQPPATTAPSAAIPAFALFDPFKPFGNPWLEPGEEDDAEPDRPMFLRPPGEPVDARPVCRRILALAAALEDLEGHARRLARWRARRHLETTRPRRWQPMRPGRPPGWRKRPKTAVEEVLKECHSLAHYAWTAPDTS